MQGDPKVDELMRPVLAAIKRHVKNSDAITDIYNRAYEAVMNGMDAKSGKTYCAYCGAEYPLDDSAATLVSEHIKTCEKHPMRAKEAETAALKARAEAAEARADALQAQLDAANEDAQACAAFLEIVLDYTRDIGHPFNVAEINAALDAHRARVGGLEK